MELHGIEMKIGIDARLFRSSIAGIGRYSQNLIKNLLEIDHENQYVLIMTPEDIAEYRKSQVQSPKSKVRIIETEINHYSLAEQTKLPKILNEEKFDLVHFLNFNHPIGYNGKFITTIHDLTLLFYPGRSKKGPFYQWAYKYIMGDACRRSKKVVAVSGSTKNDIVRVFKTNPEKVAVIYEAADDKTFAQPSAELIDSIKKQYAISGERIILYVGQWRPHKNLIGLIDAFYQIKTELKAKLVIVGKPDSAYPDVVNAIDKGVALGDIIRPGFVSEEELAAWYKIANVFVFPSFYEGFGLPGLEAMMAGTPVVASNKTSLPEVYKDAAVYFNPENTVDMAAKIKQLIQDRELSESLTQKGYQIVKSYSWQKTAEETLKIYKQI